MSKTYRCPESILNLFLHEKTKPLGRQMAIDWLKKQGVQVGDTVQMPDGETGELIEFIAGVGEQ